MRGTIRCIQTACVAWGFVLAALVWGCKDQTAPPLEITVSVVPADASLLAGGMQHFTATVANDPAAQGVTWSITGCSGGAAVCGGLTNVTPTIATYAAPAAVPPSAVGVTATSVSDNTKSFTATLAITVIGASGQIAFVSGRDGNGEIYVMNADGSGQVNLTNNPDYDDTPVWSPDGSRIAFRSARDGNSEIYVMNADGSGLQNLTNNPGHDYTPVWSPDGAKIAFVSDRDGHVDNVYGGFVLYEIYVMNADGSGPLNISNNPRDDQGPAWSPDGRRIAFGSDRDGNSEIYLMNADGSGQVNLTNDPGGDYTPVWSPDGTKIAFQRGGDLFVMNADGSGVTPGIVGGRNPDWSPDGSKIAFNTTTRHCDGRVCSIVDDNVFVTNADGSGIRQLTSNRASSSPAWSPDGTRIAFVSTRDGNSEIYLMNADGSGHVNLTNTAGGDYQPAWRPR